MPAKICNLRVDTLAIMLSQANVQAHARVRPCIHLLQVKRTLENVVAMTLTSGYNRSPMSG